MTHHATRFTARKPMTTTRKTRIAECAARKSLLGGTVGISSPGRPVENLVQRQTALQVGRTITERRPASKGRDGRGSGAGTAWALEPGGVAGRPVGARAPAHVAARGQDVVLLVEALAVLDRDLLAVPD